MSWTYRTPAAIIRHINQFGSGDVAMTRSDTNDEASVNTGVSAGDRRDAPEDESSKAPLAGPVVQQPTRKTLNFQQAGELDRSFSEKDRVSLLVNLGDAMRQIKNDDVRMTMLSYFYQADANYGTELARMVQVDPAQVRARAQANNGKVQGCVNGVKAANAKAPAAR